MKIVSYKRSLKKKVLSIILHDSKQIQRQIVRTFKF